MGKNQSNCIVVIIAIILSITLPVFSQTKTERPTSVIGNQSIQSFQRNVFHAQQFQLHIENPFTAPQRIMLHLWNQYDLGVFQPGEKRILDNINLPIIHFQPESITIEETWLEFENGKKSLLTENLGKNIPILDITNSKKELFDHNKMTKINNQFYYYFTPFMRFEDRRHCILKSLEHFRESYPDKPVPVEFNLLNIEKQLDRGYFIPACNGQIFIDDRSLMGNSPAFQEHFYNNRFSRPYYKIRQTARYITCPHCNKRTVRSSLYCIHCHELIDFDIDFDFDIDYDLAACGELGCTSPIILDGKHTRCAKNHPLSVDKNNQPDIIYYNSKEGLFQTNLTAKTKLWRLTEFNPEKKKLPPLFFDQHILSPYYKVENLQPLCVQAKQEDIYLSDCLSEKYATIFIDEIEWNKLDLQQKETYVNFCMAGGICIRYHCVENQNELIGFGRMVQIKDHYSNSTYSMEYMQNRAPRIPIIYNRLTAPMGKEHSENRIYQYPEFTNHYAPFAYRTFQQLGFIILVAFSISLLYLFFLIMRQRRINKQILWIPGISLIASIVLLSLFACTHSLKNQLETHGISIHDQNRNKIYHTAGYNYYSSLPRSSDIVLKKDILYTLSEKQIEQPNQIIRSKYSIGARHTVYQKTKWNIKNEQDYVISLNDYTQGNLLELTRTWIEDTREKLQIDLEKCTLGNGYSFSIIEACVHTPNNHYYGRNIDSGEEATLTPITKKEIQSTECFRKFHQYFHSYELLEYFNENQISYGLLLINRSANDIWKAPDCTITDSTQFYITLLNNREAE